MWTSFFLFFCSAAIASSQTYNSTAVDQCTNNAGELPMNVYVEGCETAPCPLPQLQDAILTTVFRAPYFLPSMRTVVTAYLSFIPIPYDLGIHSITCNYLENSYCPVLEGEILIYSLRLYIEPFFFVGTQVSLELRVLDHEDVPLLCFRTSIRVVAPVDGGNSKTITEAVHSVDKIETKNNETIV